MKNFSTSLKNSKASLSTATCYAIKITIDEATSNYIRRSTWDKQFTFNSEAFNPGLPIKNITAVSGSNPYCSFKLGNVDDVFTSYFLNNTLKQKNFELYEIFFDDNFNVVDGEILFKGVLDKLAMPDSQWLAVTGIPFSSSGYLKSPRRRLIPSCQVPFKSNDCGYSGTSSACNKTRETCLNTNRFTGFRFIPTPGTVFTWGNVVIKVD